MSNHPHILHIDRIEWTEQVHAPNFNLQRKQLGAAAGSQKLGCSLIEIPPDCRSWPYHYHYANEEAIYVLEGTGTLRLNGEEIVISQGNYIALLTGKIGAHQVINTGTKPLRYLCFSTMIEPDIMGYPDSGKIGVFAGAAPGGKKGERTLSKFFTAAAEVDYSEGED